jgi:hypothetical protein
MPLNITAEQIELVERLQLRRDAEGITRVMGAAWPDVAERLQARWPAFVTAALERGHQTGLRAAADLARYASLCCLWGVGFETKPGFEWAQAIVGDAKRSPPLRLHQLVQQSRQALLKHQAQSPGVTGSVLAPAALEKALEAVQAGMVQHQAGLSLFTDAPPPSLPKACDLAGVSLTWAEPQPWQAYQLREGVWVRADLPRQLPAPEVPTLAADEPPQYAVISRALGAGASARLNLGVQAVAACNDKRHPEVMHRSGQGRLFWRGPDTAALSLALHAPAPEPVDPQRGPTGIGFALPPDVQAFEVNSCGLRDAGAPTGSLALGAKVYAATQYLTEVRHSALPTLALPTEPGQAAAAPAVATCRLEADGTVQPVPTWQAAWAQLQPLTRAGLEKLFNAWGRAMHSGAHLEGDAAPLVGQAGITWGWQRNGAGEVVRQVDGQLDWAALVLDLRLSGEIEWAGARAQVQLQAQGRSEWRMRLHQAGEEAAADEGLAQAVCTWRHPWVLSLDAIVSGEPALLSSLPLAAPLRGALAGQCGLRARPDGQGLQWFYKLELEAVNVSLLLSDPLLGDQKQQRQLLPAMTLVDWSAG